MLDLAQGGQYGGLLLLDGIAGNPVIDFRTGVAG
jgi:hypothetical protein